MSEIVYSFDTALENFRAAAEAVVREHFDRNGYTFAVPGVEIASRRGSRFVKLWTTESRDGETPKRRSIHSFVEIATGDIFKPASTKAHAKHSRGSIYAADAGRSSMSDAGHINYLR